MYSMALKDLAGFDPGSLSEMRVYKIYGSDLEFDFPQDSIMRPLCKYLRFLSDYSICIIIMVFTMACDLD